MADENKEKKSSNVFRGFTKMDEARAFAKEMFFIATWDDERYNHGIRREVSDNIESNLKKKKSKQTFYFIERQSEITYGTSDAYKWKVIQMEIVADIDSTFQFISFQSIVYENLK